MAHDDNSSSKFLSLFQIDCLKPSMNQPLDRSEKLASLIPLALIAPEPRHGSPRRAAQNSAPSANVL
jgi:hypothetical protein